MKNIQHFLEKFNELIGIPLSLAGFFLVPLLLYYYCGYAGMYDPGVLHTLPYAAINLIFASFLAYFGAKMNFPGFYNNFISFMQHDLADLSKVTSEVYKRKLLCVFVYCAIYFLYLGVALLLLLNLRFTVTA